MFIGHVGGGFTANNLKDIREKLEPLLQKECPFTVKPETNAPVTWVKPELICEVALSGWAEDALMRHPVFLRLREDKAAREVVHGSLSGAVVEDKGPLQDTGNLLPTVNLNYLGRPPTPGHGDPQDRSEPIAYLPTWAHSPSPPVRA